MLSVYKHQVPWSNQNGKEQIRCNSQGTQRTRTKHSLSCKHAHRHTSVGKKIKRLDLLFKGRGQLSKKCLLNNSIAN